MNSTREQTSDGDQPVFVIEAKELKKSYQSRRGAKSSSRSSIDAVRGISFAVPQGTCFGLLGPNGAGKSTTMEMLQGILKPTGGELRVFGQEYARGEYAIRRRMGGLLQENKMYDRLKVSEALKLFRSFYQQPLALHDVLNDLGLSEVQDRYLRNLSGGQRQRVFVGTAIIGNPDLIFLDEPTTGLDPSTRQDMWNIVKNLKRQRKTIILTTHYMEEAEILCDQLLIINKGRVIEQGTSDAIIERVMHGYEIETKPRKATLNDVFLKLTGRSLASADGFDP
jgi:ABC-2 type transport system ATP-binding protein